MALERRQIAMAELRRLIDKCERKTRKVVSPVAKYSNTGILSCTACSKTVGSDDALAWEAHAECRQHKDNLQRLRDACAPPPQAAPAPALAPHVWKRPAVPPKKKIKKTLKNAPKVTLTAEKSSRSSSVTPSRPTGEMLGLAESERRYQHLGAESKRKGSVETVVSRESVVQVESTKSTKSEIPENFFDSSVSMSSRTETLSSTRRSATGDDVVIQTMGPDVRNPDDVLPEGFFDSPQLDAKERNVEYKNPADEEWERYRREMREQSSVPARIVSADQDEAWADRQVDEIDERMRNWSKVFGMEVRKEILEKTEPRKEILEQTEARREKMEQTEARKESLKQTEPIRRENLEKTEARKENLEQTEPIRRENLEKTEARKENLEQTEPIRRENLEQTEPRREILEDRKENLEQTEARKENLEQTEPIRREKMEQTEPWRESLEQRKENLEQTEPIRRENLEERKKILEQTEPIRREGESDRDSSDDEDVFYDCLDWSG